MKATGIVRRIDELGRIVIPKEIRRTLRMKEGEQLEIFTQDDETVVLKKYSPVKRLSQYAQAYTNAVNKATGCLCIITDNDHVISISDNSQKHIMGERLSDMLIEIIRRRQQFVSVPYAKSISISQSMTPSDEAYEVISPIISDSAVCGCLILINEKQDMSLKEYAATGASFLGNIMQY